MTSPLFTTTPEGVVVRVAPDHTGPAKEFDYLVPAEDVDDVRVGTQVRVQLGPRRVGAWVTAVGVEPEPGVALRAIAKVSGHGPPGDVIDLARWARWRWAAKSMAPFLRAASPLRHVRTLPPAGERRHPVPAADDDRQGAFTAGGPTVLRLPPTDDLLGVVQAAVHLGDALFVCATPTQVERVAARLRRAGVAVAVVPDEWDRAAAGGVSVVGQRNAVWAPVPDLAAVVVIDEHDEVHQAEGSPTWHARDVAVERGRRAAVPVVLTSPAPTVVALSSTRLHTVPRAEERAGWPALVVADRREEDQARNALFSPVFAEVVRSGDRVVAILNKKGRATLLACNRCGDIAQCTRCQASCARPDDRLVCRRCGEERPVVCAACGATDLRTVRMGVGRVQEDLSALAREPVTLLTGDTSDDEVDRHRLVVGTEAALHRVDDADVVAFLDFDQELYAPRMRAAEQAMALLVRAARLVGGRSGGGRLLVQTRDPDHEVLRGALAGDPSVVAEAEDTRRRELAVAPHGAVAELGGSAAGEFADRLRAVAPSEVAVLGPLDDRWQVRAPTPDVLSDALAAVERPPGRLRLAVDPPRS